MTRYDRLSKTEHIFSMTEHEVKYLEQHLRTNGPLSQRPLDQEDHQSIIGSCKQLLDGKQPYRKMRTK